MTRSIEGSDFNRFLSDDVVVGFLSKGDVVVGFLSKDDVVVDFFQRVTLLLALVTLLLAFLSKSATLLLAFVKRVTLLASFVKRCLLVFCRRVTWNQANHRLPILLMTSKGLRRDRRPSCSYKSAAGEESQKLS